MADYDNPRPSSQPEGSTEMVVAKDNLITLDLMAVSSDPTVTNRKGQVLTTFIGASDKLNADVAVVDAAKDQALIDIAEDVAEVDAAAAIAIPAFESLGQDAIDDFNANGDAALGALGGVHVGEYSTDPLITERNQYVTFGVSPTATQWKITDSTSLNYQIDSTTYPDPEDDPSLIMFNDLTKQALAGYTQLAFKVVSDVDLGLTVLGSITPKLGDRITVEDYATGNNSGVLFFRVVAAATGVDDGGKYIDLPILGLQLEQNLKSPHNAKAWGARGLGTDDTAAFLAALAYTDVLFVPDPEVKYLLTPPLDLSNKTLFGESLTTTFIEFTALQVDCITTSSNTIIRDVNLHGGWDGATQGQLGDLIRASSVGFATGLMIDRVRLVRAKQDSLSISNFGYSSIGNVRSNASGRHGLNLDGAGGNTNTTIGFFGRNVFSDCPFGYGAIAGEVHNTAIRELICEFTNGIRLEGSANRCVVLDSNYTEFGGSANAIEIEAACIGLTVTNNFCGAKAINHVTGNLFELTKYGNSNFSSDNLIQSNDVKYSVGAEMFSATTGAETSATGASLALDTGVWSIIANFATAGATVLTSIALLITDTEADSAYQGTTSTNYTPLTDYDYTPTDGPNRLKVADIIEITAPTTYYARFGYNQVSGTLGSKVSIRAVRIK